MKSAKTYGGVKITWGATHRDPQGTLISRQVSIDPPVLNCPSCIGKYLKESLLYALVTRYHTLRVAYAEKNRHKIIPEKYRTGEKAPETIGQAILANIKLKGGK